MNFRKAVNETEDTFQIAPMIDVVFIMLVFFVYISALNQLEREMNVRPPVAKNSSAIERKPEEIIINVKEDGTIIINQVERTLDDLRDRLRLLSAAGGADSSVMIRADALTAHQNVVNVIDACMAAEMTKFSFITVEKENGAGMVSQTR